VRAPDPPRQREAVGRMRDRRAGVLKPPARSERRYSVLSSIIDSQHLLPEQVSLARSKSSVCRPYLERERF
jgi:hypothetical protein